MHESKQAYKGNKFQFAWLFRTVKLDSIILFQDTLLFLLFQAQDNLSEHVVVNVEHFLLLSKLIRKFCVFPNCLINFLSQKKN